MTLEVIATIVGIIGASIPVLLGIWKYVVNPSIEFFKRAIKVFEIVEKELTPNSGSSIRDAISRIDHGTMMVNARSKALFQHSRLALWESDKDGSCIYASRDLCRLVGRSAEEILGNGWRNMIAPHDRTRVESEWDDAVREQRDFISEYAYILPDNTITSVKVNCFALRDSHNNLMGFIGIATDSEK